MQPVLEPRERLVKLLSTLDIPLPSVTPQFDDPCAFNLRFESGQLTNDVTVSIRRCSTLFITAAGQDVMTVKVVQWWVDAWNLQINPPLTPAGDIDQYEALMNEEDAISGDFPTPDDLAATSKIATKWTDLDQREQRALRESEFPVVNLEYIAEYWRSLEAKGLVHIIRIDHRYGSVHLTSAGTVLLHTPTDPALTETAKLIAELRTKLAAAEDRAEELEERCDSLLETARVANDLFVEHIEMVTAPTRKEIFVHNKIAQADLEARLNGGWEILHIQFVHNNLSVVLTREVPIQQPAPARAAATIVHSAHLVTMTPLAANTVQAVDTAVYAPANINHLSADIIDAESPDYVNQVINARMPTAEKMRLLNKDTMNVVKAARTPMPVVTYSPLPAVHHG